MEDRTANSQVLEVSSDPDPCLQASSPPPAARVKKFCDRELNPGLSDGNAQFYHQTITDCLTTCPLRGSKPPLMEWRADADHLALDFLRVLGTSPYFFSQASRSRVYLALFFWQASSYSPFSFWSSAFHISLMIRVTSVIFASGLSRRTSLYTSCRQRKQAVSARFGGEGGERAVDLLGLAALDMRMWVGMGDGRGEEGFEGNHLQFYTAEPIVATQKHLIWLKELGQINNEQPSSSPQLPSLKSPHQFARDLRQLAIPLLQLSLSLGCELVTRLGPEICVAIGRAGGQGVNWLVFTPDRLGFVLDGAQTTIGLVLDAGGLAQNEGFGGHFDLLGNFGGQRGGAWLPVLREPLLQLDLAEVALILPAAHEFPLALPPRLPAVGRERLRLSGLLIALALFGGENAEVQFDAFLIERVAAEHGEEVEPLGVHDGVVDVLAQHRLVELVEVVAELPLHQRYFISNKSNSPIPAGNARGQGDGARGEGGAGSGKGRGRQNCYGVFQQQSVMDGQQPVFPPTKLGSPSLLGIFYFSALEIPFPSVLLLYRRSRFFHSEYNMKTKPIINDSNFPKVQSKQPLFIVRPKPSQPRLQPPAASRQGRTPTAPETAQKSIDECLACLELQLNEEQPMPRSFCLRVREHLLALRLKYCPEQQSYNQNRKDPEPLVRKQSSRFFRGQRTEAFEETHNKENFTSTQNFSTAKLMKGKSDKEEYQIQIHTLESKLRQIGERVEEYEREYLSFEHKIKKLEGDLAIEIKGKIELKEFLEQEVNKGKETEFQLRKTLNQADERHCLMEKQLQAVSGCLHEREREIVTLWQLLSK